jgi:hypothetical protein
LRQKVAVEFGKLVEPSDSCLVQGLALESGCANPHASAHC